MSQPPYQPPPQWPPQQPPSPQNPPQRYPPQQYPPQQYPPQQYPPQPVPPQQYPPQRYPPQQYPPQQYPPQPPPPYYQPPPKPPRKRLSCFVIGLIVLVVTCLVVGVGGYLLVRSNKINQSDLFALVGQGSGDVNITNLSDAEMRVTFTALDAEGSSPFINDIRLKPNEISGFAGKAGRYQMKFSGAFSATCTLELKVKDYYQFVVVSQSIAVVRNNQTPQNGRELDVTTSSLCKK